MRSAVNSEDVDYLMVSLALVMPIETVANLTKELRFKKTSKRKLR